jgi:hypothetical protein
MIMPKRKLSSRIKIALLNIMEALGAAASHMASSAKVRVAEINLQSRRHEILTEFSLQAFEMWHNGVQLPKELSDLFVEISEIDDKLSILCAQKYVKVKIEPEEQGAGDEQALPETEDTPLPVCTPPAEKPAVPEEPKKPRPTIRKTASSKPKE